MTNVSNQALIGLLDVTRLQEDDTPTTFGQWLGATFAASALPAAYCVYPQFLTQTQQFLSAAGVQLPLATVVNFPSGDLPLPTVLAEITNAIELGAAEIDAVLPYRALMAGKVTQVTEFMQAVRQACGELCLKIIIESGELATADLIGQATELAIAGGADFVKTSTGKVDVGVTLDAARVILQIIAKSNQPVGFKASGGVRTPEFARQIVDLSQETGKSTPTAAHLRIGASALYLTLLQA